MAPPTFLLLLTIFISLFSLTMADISCYICTPSSMDPLKCLKPEYLGTYKTCQPESTTCFKFVDPSTGEVRKGCGGMDSSKTLEQGMSYCDTRLCNNANNITMYSAVILGVVYIILLTI